MRDRVEISALIGVAAFLTVFTIWAIFSAWANLGILITAALIGLVAAIATFVVDWFTGRPK